MTARKTCTLRVELIEFDPSGETAEVVSRSLAETEIGMHEAMSLRAGEFVGLFMVPSAHAALKEFRHQRRTSRRPRKEKA